MILLFWGGVGRDVLGGGDVKLLMNQMRRALQRSGEKHNIPIMQVQREPVSKVVGISGCNHVLLPVGLIHRVSQSRQERFRGGEVVSDHSLDN